MSAHAKMFMQMLWKAKKEAVLSTCCMHTHTNTRARWIIYIICQRVVCVTSGSVRVGSIEILGNVEKVRNHVSVRTQTTPITVKPHFSKAGPTQQGELFRTGGWLTALDTERDPPRGLRAQERIQHCPVFCGYWRTWRLPRLPGYSLHLSVCELKNIFLGWKL